MSTSLIKLSTLLVFTFAIFVSSASALQISEIMYDPAGSDTGNEWIELYNDTASDINLTTYKLFENNTNHGITASQGGNIISAGEYVVVADNVVNFLSSHSGHTGKVFDSAFSLSNSGELLEMRDSNATVLYSVSYSVLAGANGTGATLNLISDNWVAYLATPGLISSQISVSSNDNNVTTIASSTATTTNTSSATNTSSTTTSTTTNNGVEEISNINANINSQYVPTYTTGWYTSRTYSLGDINMLTPKEVYTVVGAETYFFVKPIDSKKNTIVTNTYWSYGDGSEGSGVTSTHRYYNSGTYIAYVESEVNNAYGVERIRVYVDNPDISIIDVSEAKVTLKNNSNKDLNIGGFILASDQGYFKLSRQLLILQNGTLKIDGRAVGFTKLSGVKLLTAYSTTVAEYKDNNFATASSSVSPAYSNTASTSPTSTSLYKKSTTTSTSIFKNKNKIIKRSIVSYNNKNNNAAKIDKTFKNNNDIKNSNTSTDIDTNTSPAVSQTSESVNNTSIKKGKNWLYWLYE